MFIVILQERIEKFWSQVDEQCRQYEKEELKTFPIKRKCGEVCAVRLFVSSTFVDFNSEREILVKKTFPALREWCEKRRLRLFECDLRWGVPRDSTTRTTLLTCFEELDRCREAQHNQPLFLNLTGDRYGWIPGQEEISSDIQEKYDWIEESSITLMEVLHAAYRNKNSNAAFFIRNNSFLRDLPENFNHRFQQDDEFSKAQILVNI